MNFAPTNRSILNLLLNMSLLRSIHWLGTVLFFGHAEVIRRDKTCTRTASFLSTGSRNNRGIVSILMRSLRRRWVEHLFIGILHSGDTSWWIGAIGNSVVHIGTHLRDVLWVGESLAGGRKIHIVCIRIKRDRMASTIISRVG